jgi:hypothetical protein
MSWWRAGVRGAVGCATLLALGCGGGSPRVSLAPPERAPRHQDYDGIRNSWTRSARIIKQLDTTLRVHATLFSPEFSAAYHARQSQMFRLSAEKKRELGRALEDQWAKAFVFFVAAATIDSGWNDFDHKKSVWRIALVNDRGDQVDAAEIREEKRNATMEALFPYVGHFHRTYKLTFPKVRPDGQPLVRGDTRSLALRFAGPLGQAELTWRLR